MTVSPIAGIRVEGVRKLTSGLNKAGGRELTKRMGQANKQNGIDIIARLQPLPSSVGLGAGAKVRPSANPRLVQLKAGGAHRNGTSADAVRVRSWGRTRTARATARPYIAETAIRALPNIEQRYLDGVDAALRGSNLPGAKP